MKLKDYESKRDFDQTPEPRPGLAPRGDGLTFVVHKHAARNLHYDLRLEMDGVLKSWAVPKGPSLNPAVKRLAMMVEDHPLDYRDFEGFIPEHNYGAGGVIVWDRGFYRHPSARDPDENAKLLHDGLMKGDLKFILEGEKLKGEFALVKMKNDEKSWLLLKKKDRYGDAKPATGENRSVLSGKTLEEIVREEPGPSHARDLDRIRLREALEGPDLADAPAAPMPHRVNPMLATLVQRPFDDPGWIFEMKWDGYRAIAEIDGGVSLYSRNGLSFNKKFAPIAEALGHFGFEAVLDGEIVVVDDRGYPDFQRLQDYEKAKKGHLVYYVFDILHFQGHDLSHLPLIRRKALLKRILPASPRVRYSDHVVKDGVAFFEAVREKGLEGMMAKESESTYRAGRRTRHWLKVKTRLTQDGVIAGFTEPRGGRGYFGSLVLGAFEGDELVYIGHSGGGFAVEDLKEIRGKLDPLVQEACPFRSVPKTETAVTWVQPVLVCEVAFQGWTGEGLMRQPVFLRLREDKPAREAVREGPPEDREAAPAMGKPTPVGGKDRMP